MTDPTISAGIPQDPATAGLGSVFYDSAEHIDLIPRGADAALYSDGAFMQSPAAAELFGRVRWITVRGNAKTSSIADLFEQPWYRPALLRGFVRGRRARGMAAIVYTNMSHAAEQLADLRDFGHGELAAYDQLYWWVATLDGQRRTASALAMELAGIWDAEITADRLWAQQFDTAAGGDIDVSQRYIAWRP